MANILLENITKVYPNGVRAVKKFNLEINDGDFIVIVGPSGCGKTTVMRMIAGLEEITDGKLYINGTLANDLIARDRDVAMVFQNFALYADLPVYDNIAFGLKMRNIDPKIIDDKVSEVSKMLGLENLLTRMPRQLSGGQKQRVALAKAIVRNPNIYLFDEPLSNLDSKLRVETRKEISQLHKQVNGTFLYITHDYQEALALGTKLVVMNNGEIVQIGAPKEIYDKPQNMFVASFFGAFPFNFIPGEALGLDENINVGIRPEYIKLDFSVDGIELIGHIDHIDLVGSYYLITLLYREEKILVKTNTKNLYRIGQELKVLLPKDKILYYDKETKNLIEK